MKRQDVDRVEILLQCLTDPKEIELDNELYKIEGLRVVVSDKISVNQFCA